MKKIFFNLTITFIVFAFSACTQKDSTAVVVKEYESCCGTQPVTYSNGDMLVYFPNVFTPNADGVNDMFYPILNANVNQASNFVVTDTLDNLLFQREEFIPKDLVNYAWDGKDQNGKPYKGLFKYHLIVPDGKGGALKIQGKACCIVCGADAAVFKTKEGCFYSTQAKSDGTLDKTLPTQESGCFK